MFELSFYAGLGLTVLLLLVGHWFPWPCRLPRLWAYVYGVVSIGAGVGIWLGVSGQYVVLAGIAAIATSGGIAVVLAYQIDHAVQLIRMGRRAERMFEDGDAE